MKTNHIPREERLRNRISILQRKLIEPVPYGGDNPYSQCGSCGRSMVEVSYAGHFKGCQVVGVQNEIKHYQKLLEESS